MDVRTIGYAELCTRLLQVLLDDDPGTQFLRAYADQVPDWFDGKNEPNTIHAHVIVPLGVQVDAILNQGLNAECPSDVFGAVGLPLTVGAASFADAVWLLECQGFAWDECVRMSRRVPGELRVSWSPVDRQLGRSGVVTLLRRAAVLNSEPESPLPPQWFTDGTPASLMGHLLAELGITADIVGCLSAAHVVDVLSYLGWTVSDRARAVLDAAERVEARGLLRWSEIAELAHHYLPTTLAEQPWD